MALPQGRITLATSRALREARMMALFTCNIAPLNAHSARRSHGIIMNVMNGFSFGTFKQLTKTISFPAVGRQRLHIRMLDAANFRQQPEVAGFGSQRAGGKAKHKILTLDLTKVEEVHKFDVFARKCTKEEPSAKWESIGEIFVEKEANVESALKERRKKLLAAAQHQYPSFLILSAGEEVQYGYRKASEEETENDIMAVDIKGKELDSSIPALLRADDGVKPPTKRY